MENFTWHHSNKVFVTGKIWETFIFILETNTRLVGFISLILFTPYLSFSPSHQSTEDSAHLFSYLLTSHMGAEKQEDGMSPGVNTFLRQTPSRTCCFTTLAILVILHPGGKVLPQFSWPWPPGLHKNHPRAQRLYDLRGSNCFELIVKRKGAAFSQSLPCSLSHLAHENYVKVSYE